MVAKRRLISTRPLHTVRSNVDDPGTDVARIRRLQSMTGPTIQFAQKQHDQGQQILSMRPRKKVFDEGQVANESPGKGIWKGGRCPFVFSGEPQQYHEWKMKMWAYLRINVGKRLDVWLGWAQVQK